MRSVKCKIWVSKHIRSLLTFSHQITDHLIISNRENERDLVPEQDFAAKNASNRFETVQEHRWAYYRP